MFNAIILNKKKPYKTKREAGPNTNGLKRVSHKLDVYKVTLSHGPLARTGTKLLLHPCSHEHDRGVVNRHHTWMEKHWRYFFSFLFSFSFVSIIVTSTRSDWHSLCPDWHCLWPDLSYPGYYAKLLNVVKDTHDTIMVLWNNEQSKLPKAMTVHPTFQLHHCSQKPFCAWVHLLFIPFEVIQLFIKCLCKKKNPIQFLACCVIFWGFPMLIRGRFYVFL